MAELNSSGTGWIITDEDCCDIAVASGFIEDTPEARAAWLAQTSEDD